MNIPSNYQSHVAITKELKMHSDFVNYRAPHKENFEKIYNEAKEQKVTMSNAKEFLNSLSKEEMKTLQHYSGLADEIKIGTLNDEGAYNLLLHHYEKFDFNNDGIIHDGLAMTGSLIPVNMPDTEKKALVKSLNEMDENEAFHAMLFINLPKFIQMDNELVAVQDDTTVTYEVLMERINRIINPLPGERIDENLKNTFRKFKDIFEKNYQEEQAGQNSYINNRSYSYINKAKLNA